VAEFPNIPWAWQGLYGGVHIGAADAFNDDGLVGGVQIGHNWQTGRIVYGIEADISFTDFDFIDWMGTVRGRLGYLISPSILIYGTGGLGVVDFDGGGSESEFVYGLGIEGRLTQATSVRLEYIGWSDSEIDVIRAGVNFRFNW
jgi:outer membrane immunogenic protein